jgi:hypothetical protein
MITIVDACPGGLRLARHLANQSGNEEVRIAQTQGLIGVSIEDCVAELGALAHGARTDKPIVHAIASPQFDFRAAQWEAYWSEFEDEFGMAGHPFLEVEHLKFGAGGRTARHRHRLYLRIGVDGKAVNLSHSAARAEKLSRIAEFMAGEPVVAGRFNRAVIAALRRQGRLDIVEFLEAAGLDSTHRPVAADRAERQQAERLEDIAPDEIWKRAWLAWARSSDGPGLVRALADEGLMLAAGEKGPVIITPAGAVTSLRRAVANGAAQVRANRVRKREIDARLGGLALPGAATLPARQVSVLDRRSNGVVGSPRRAAPPFAASDPVANHQRTDHVAELRPAAQPVDHTSMQLTAEQQQAIMKFSDALAGEAARLATRLRQDAEFAARSHLEHLRARAEQKRIHDQQVRHALDVVRETLSLAADLDSPAVGPVSWRSIVKAEIAGLPHELGAIIRWVQREDAGKNTIHLMTREVVRTSARWATSTGESAASTAIMVAHAKLAGWDAVQTSGGTPEWRCFAARRMTRAGLKVSNPELQAVVRGEAERIERPKRLVAAWEAARRMTSEEPDDRFARERFMTILRLCRENPLVRELMPRRQRVVFDHDIAELRKREWLLADTGFELHEFEDCALGWSARKTSTHAPSPSGFGR